MLHDANLFVIPNLHITLKSAAWTNQSKAHHCSDAGVGNPYWLLTQYASLIKMERGEERRQIDKGCNCCVHWLRCSSMHHLYLYFLYCLQSSQYDLYNKHLFQVPKLSLLNAKSSFWLGCYFSLSPSPYFFKLELFCISFRTWKDTPLITPNQCFSHNGSHLLAFQLVYSRPSHANYYLYSGGLFKGLYLHYLHCHMSARHWWRVGVWP